MRVKVGVALETGEMNKTLVKIISGMLIRRIALGRRSAEGTPPLRSSTSSTAEPSKQQSQFQQLGPCLLSPKPPLLFRLRTACYFPERRQRLRLPQSVYLPHPVPTNRVAKSLMLQIFRSQLPSMIGFHQHQMSSLLKRSELLPIKVRNHCNGRPKVN